MASTHGGGYIYVTCSGERDRDLAGWSVFTCVGWQVTLCDPSHCTAPLSFLFTCIYRTFRQLRCMGSSYRMANQVQTCLLNLPSIAHQSSHLLAYSIGLSQALEVHAFICQSRYFQFHATNFHLVLVLFVSQLPKYGIPYRPTFCSLKQSLHLDVI